MMGKQVEGLAFITKPIFLVNPCLKKNFSFKSFSHANRLYFIGGFLKKANK
jgi:hypothetical protein